MKRRILRLLLLSGLVAPAALLIGGASAPPVAEAGNGSVIALRRLTQDQYRQSIADIFGDDIKVSARLEIDPRREGLIAVGTAQAAVSAPGFEQYDSAAREVAGQIVDPRHRATLIGCAPADAGKADDRCARQFFTRVGRRLYRRPLAAGEVARLAGIAGSAATAKQDFYAGLGLGLSTMLVSPQFLFRMERAERTLSGYRLDDYSLASRLSFLIWNAPPDDALLLAAEKGRLRTAKGMREQTERLLASPRFEQGVRAFFSDMLALEQLGGVQRDLAIYPRFSARLAADAREQTLRTIVYHLVQRDAPYRELFTTRRTFLSRSLGLLYSLPVTSPGGWEAHEFAEDDPRAGLLAQPSFLLTHSHPGRSSPTLRGKAIRELLLCQPVPPPPPNVDFALVQDVSNPRFATARLRLKAHSSDPVCAGCHMVTDPLGLALENFDGGAGLRDRENGAKIDASGELNGLPFQGPPGLGKALAEDPGLSACLVERAYSYGTGAGVGSDAIAWLEQVDQRYAVAGIRIRDLFREIALSGHFSHLQDAGGKTVADASMVGRNQGDRR